jgi:PPK2 family polyphosphate:nucleotide phosphotransferase
MSSRAAGPRHLRYHRRVKSPTFADIAARYRVTNGRRFRLADIDPADPWGGSLKPAAGDLMEEGLARLTDLQERLYAQDRWSVLLVFQAMDAAGKDGTIKAVMSGVNPQGCEVHSFKAPSSEELDHDFLWRNSRVLPRRGHIGIFNRSYYEETLVVRVHQNILARQQLPPSLVTRNIWRERFEDINAYERYLSRQGVVIRKFFLHVSKEEQRLRFLKRLDEADKYWKFSPADVGERAHFAEYMHAYEDTIRRTSTEWAPWHVIPADRKWFTRLAVAATIIETIESLDPRFPSADPKVKEELTKIKAALEAEVQAVKSKAKARSRKP